MTLEIWLAGYEDELGEFLGAHPEMHIFQPLEDDLATIHDFARDLRHLVWVTWKPDPGVSEREELWSEAREALRRHGGDPFATEQAFLQTRLGSLLHEFIHRPGSSRGALAAFDGCLDMVVRGPRQSCWWFICSLVLHPWHGMGDPLVVWKVNAKD